LIAGLGKALRTAVQTNAIAKQEGFRIEDGGQLKAVAIKVIPFSGSASSEERHFLVLFEDAGPNGGAKTAHSPAVQDNRESARLRRELAATKEYLQSIVEDNASYAGGAAGGRTKRRRRAMRSWKPRRKSWNRPTKN
jgi:two-component system CheB/CheR fusion protein